MTDFIPDGYLNIDQSIEKVGKSLFPDWEEGLSKKHSKKKGRNFDGNYYIYDFFITHEQQTNLRNLLSNNLQNNQEASFIFIYNNCSLKKTGYSSIYSEISCSEKRIEINLREQHNHQYLNEIYKLSDVRNRIRQALIKEKIIAHVLNEDGKILPLESHIWAVDEHWQRLLFGHSLFMTDKEVIINGIFGWIQGHRGKVLFDENDVNGFVLSYQTLDASTDQVIAEQLFKNIREGKRSLRGTERFYLMAKNHFSEEEIQKHKKGDFSTPKGNGLIGELYKFAEDHQFIIVQKSQKQYAEKNQEQKKAFDQKCITHQEIENIAGFLKPSYAQVRGNK